MPDKVVVALVTNDPMLEFAVRHLFGADRNAFELGSTVRFQELSKVTAHSEVHVVLADIAAIENTECVADLRQSFPGALILCWCNPADAENIASLRTVCDGIVSRQASGEHLIAALCNLIGRDAKAKDQAEGTQINLTYRESQLMTLLARGCKNKEISKCLGITTGTVKVYMSKLFSKTGAKDRFELSLFGLKNMLYGIAERSEPVPVPMAAKRALSRPIITSIRVMEPKLSLTA